MCERTTQRTAHAEPVRQILVVALLLGLSAGLIQSKPSAPKQHNLGAISRQKTGLLYVTRRKSKAGRCMFAFTLSHGFAALQTYYKSVDALDEDMMDRDGEGRLHVCSCFQ